MIPIALLPSILEIGGRVLDKVFPDPEQRAKAQLELMKLDQEGQFKELDAQLQVSLAQAKINEADAASQNPFQAGWRPAAGWVCVAGLAYQFIVCPLLPWALTVCGVHDVPPLPGLDDILFELILGMLGLGGLRTAEKHRRVKALEEVARR